jgi:hypothetical protein
LQQFEELMKAAEETGYAARPLPLFYALSQAGQAVEACAGHNPPRNHGLSVGSTAGALLQVSVDPSIGTTHSGRFQSVSKAIASPPLKARVQLGALMASIPELAPHVPPSGDDRWRHPIEILPVEHDGPGAHWRNATWESYRLVFGERVETAAALEEVLLYYPEIKGRWKAPYGGRDMLPLFWHADGHSHLESILLDDGGKGPSGIVASYREAYFLSPAVVSDDPPPCPLMTWWLITFGLSMLARYHPRLWVDALDIDASSEAVLLERCMEEALAVLPELVESAIIDAARSDPANRA